MTPADIQFDPATHIYRVGGRIVRSVTQVLEDGGLSDWSGVPAAVLRDAQVRGTMVHRACHFINKNNLDPASIDERIGGYIEAYNKFKRDWQLQVRHSETMIYRRLQITGEDSYVSNPTDLEIIGTLDLEGSIRKINDLLIDIKTGEPTEAWGPQTAGYLRAFSRSAQHTHKRLLLQLKKTGNYKMHWMPLRNFGADWERFRWALIEGKRKQLLGAIT